MKHTKKKNVLFHKSAGGVVLFDSRHILYVAILKKSNGEWALPKGHIKQGEKTLIAAQREIKEELGINGAFRLINKLKVARYDFKLNGDIRTHFKKVYLFVFLSKEKYKLFPLKKENFIEARWLPIKIATTKLTHESELEAVASAIKIFVLWKEKKK